MSSGNGSNGKKIHALYILLIVSYFAIIITQLRKTFVADEIAFVKAAIGIATAGLPVYTGANNELQYALWHPTLYVTLLGASFKLFGIHEWSARLVSVIFTLATLVLVYLTARAIFNDRTVTFLSCFLFLSSPLIIQGSLLIDIDNSILMFLMTFFIYIYIIIDKKKTLNLFVLGVIFGILLWAKLPAPPLLLISIVLFHWLNRNLRRGIKESLVIFSVGGILFFGTWYLYTRFLNLSFLEPFLHNSGYLNLGENSLQFFLTHLWGLKNIIFWADPFFIVLILIISFKRVNLYMRTKVLEISDLLLIIGLLIFIQYLLVGSYQTQDFPRYFIPMMPLFSILAADLTGKFEWRFKDRELLFIAIFIIQSIYIISVVGDPLLIDRIIFEPGSINDIAIKTGIELLLFLSPFLIAYLLLRIAGTGNAMIPALVISLIALNVNIDVIQSRADYATGYFYGEKGMDKLIDYSRANIDPGDAIIAREDVAYYIRASDFYIMPWDSKAFDDLVSSKNVTYLILNKEGYFTSQKHAQIFEEIKRSFEMISQLGDFKVYRRINKISDNDAAR